MARKSRRSAVRYSTTGGKKKKAKPRKYSPTVNAGESTHPSDATELASQPSQVLKRAVSSQSKGGEVSGDFRYVSAELKRIGTIAAGIVVILIILSFVF